MSAQSVYSPREQLRDLVEDHADATKDLASAYRGLVLAQREYERARVELVRTLEAVVEAGGEP